MACDITAGRAKACKSNLGGHGKLFLYNDIEDPFTYANGVATAINVGITTVFQFDITGDNNTLEQSQVSDRNTGVTVNTQTLTVSLPKQDATTSANMNLLCYGFAHAVVKDRNGVYHAVGIDDGIDWTVVASTGGAKTDANGYTLTGVSTTAALAPQLDGATITALEALV